MHAAQAYQRAHAAFTGSLSCTWHNWWRATRNLCKHVSAGWLASTFLGGLVGLTSAQTSYKKEKDTRVEAKEWTIKVYKEMWALGMVAHQAGCAAMAQLKCIKDK